MLRKIGIIDMKTKIMKLIHKDSPDRVLSQCVLEEMVYP
jgi:hypothetical protein